MNAPQDNAELNLEWCAALATGLVAAGIEQIVLSPGSRSTPLALACLRHPQLACEVVLDERSAGWFALGMAKAGAKTVALLCTSGTAVANWLPATVEANLSGVPLLLLSADRPPELQGWGANQTIDQSTLLNSQLRAFHAPGAAFPGFDPRWLTQLVVRATHESRWPRPGPVQINLAFREPLLPEHPVFSFAPVTPTPPTLPRLIPDATALGELAMRLQRPGGAIVCGETNGDEALSSAIAGLAERLQCPILAEPASGLRFGTHTRDRVHVRYDHWLCAAPSQLPDGDPVWVLRVGAFPVTRQLQQYLARASEQYLVEACPQWRDPLHRTDLLLQADPLAVITGLLEVLSADDSCAEEKSRTAEAEGVVRTLTEARRAAGELPVEAGLIAELCATLPDDTRFFCGNSMAIRDLDAFSGSGPKLLRFFVNRGASGIDGNIATAAGIAQTGPTLALVGDLSTQHDVGSLALMRGRPLVAIVINNGGGGIFDFLPQAGLPEFERGWLTPQHFDLEAAARAFDVPYVKATNTVEAVTAANRALAEAQALLIEFPVDRAASLGRRRKWKETVVQALSKAASACSP